MSRNSKVFLVVLVVVFLLFGVVYKSYPKLSAWIFEQAHEVARLILRSW